MDRPSSSSTDCPRTIWTPKRDRFFIKLVTDEVHRGNMINLTFRKQVWVKMTTQFNRKFGYHQDDVLKNRYRSLRRKYNEITTILNQDGFHWDGARQMVIADDNVWDLYIKGHPEKRTYRTKVLPYYSDLCLIFGNMLADGKPERLGKNGSLIVLSSRTTSIGVETTPSMSHLPVGQHLKVSWTLLNCSLF